MKFTRSIFCMFLFLLLSLQIHYSKQGQLFKSQVQSMHKEILQSPWLCELMAFHINLRETKVKSRKAHALFDGCSLTFKDGKPSLTCELFDSIKVDIDLTCSICLVSFSVSVIGWICLDFSVLFIVYLNICILLLCECNQGLVYLKIISKNFKLKSTSVLTKMNAYSLTILFVYGFICIVSISDFHFS